MKYVTVVRVDYDGNPAERARETPDRASLCRMCMYDFRPFTAYYSD